MTAAAAVGVCAARMDGNLSGFTDVRSLHYHGIQYSSGASEWISRGMRVCGFSGCGRRGRETGENGSRVGAKFRYTDGQRATTAPPPPPNQRPLSDKLSRRSIGNWKASDGSDVVTLSP